MVRSLAVVLVLLGCSPANGLPGATSPPPSTTLSLTVARAEAGGRIELVARHARPGETVRFVLSTAPPGAGPCLPAFGGLCLDLAAPRLLGSATADWTGRATLSAPIPAAARPGAVARVQAAVDRDADSRKSPVVVAGVCAPGERWDGTCRDPAATAATDFAVLTSGVAQIEAGGTPSPVLAVGAGALSVVRDEDGATLVAAARAGAGKVLAVGHEAYLGAVARDTGRLWVNAVGWMAGPGARVGLPAGLGATSAALQAAGHQPRVAGPRDLATLDVLVLNGQTELPPSEVDAVLAFVRGGGGLIVGGQSWYYSYAHADAELTWPGNRLLLPLGLDVWPGYASGGVDVVAPYEPLAAAWAALGAARDVARGALTLSAGRQRIAEVAARDAIGLAARAPALEALWVEASRLLDVTGPSLPTASAPLPPTGLVDGTRLRIEAAAAATLPADELGAHPAAATFPGAVGAGSARQTVTVDGRYDGMDGRYLYAGAGEAVWRSTGLYARPGQPVTVEVPVGAAGAGLGLRIGAHTDTLWHLPAVERFPEVTRGWALDAPTVTVASAFGGPVYVTVPAGVDVGPVDVTVDGAVPMPRFVRGETTASAWTATLRALPVPWAELQTEGLVLTLPAAQVRGLADPGPLLTRWQDVLDADADLAAMSVRPRAERIVLDEQISAGWMHSGYPIMGFVDLDVLADPTAMASEGDWGAFHELGHNHQWRDWLLPGTTEASCNLWSVYAMEEVIGRDRALAHPALDPGERAARVADYLASGPDFWGRWDVWTALETYLQLQERFGWGLFIALNAEYTALPDGAVADSDQARIDEWVARSSLAAGMDLRAFYRAWGFPFTAAVDARVAGLPPWLDHPLAP